MAILHTIEERVNAYLSLPEEVVGITFGLGVILIALASCCLFPPG